MATDRRVGYRYSLSLAFCMLLLASPTTLAGAIGVGGPCTLVDAIIAANTDLPAGGCGAGSGADTLTLSGDVTLTLAAESDALYGETGLPPVTSDITIEGAGFVIERDAAAPEFRIFHHKVGKLTLRNVTVRGGIAQGDSPANEGGAIYVSNPATFPEPELVLDRTILTNNEAETGGALYSLIATLTILNSVITENEGLSTGGLYLFFTLGTITDSTISGNVATSSGGLSTINAVVELERVTVSGNRASGGGGGFSGSESVVTFRNSTISENIAAVGGGTHLDTAVGGGAEFNFEHVTITRNSAPIAAGIYFTVFDPGAATFTNSIVAGNLGGMDCGGTDPVTDNGNNFDGDGSCPAGFAPIVAGVDFDLVLADNGGPTLTHALFDGSPAIDAAGACGLATDQRGALRIDGACDSGAYEFEAPLLVIMASMSATPTPEGVAISWTTLREADVAAFRVLRAASGSREKAGGENAVAISGWIPAAGNALVGAAYEWVDRSRIDLTVTRYYIEELDLYGRITQHGPVVPVLERSDR